MCVSVCVCLCVCVCVHVGALSCVMGFCSCTGWVYGYVGVDVGGCKDVGVSVCMGVGVGVGCSCLLSLK